MKNKVLRVYQHEDGKLVVLKQENGKTTIDMPRPMWDPMGTTIAIQIEGNALEQ